MFFLDQISQCKAICPAKLAHPDYSEKFHDFDATQALETQAFGGQISIKSMLYAKNSFCGKLMFRLDENAISCVRTAKKS